MPHDGAIYALLFGAGLVAGVLNVVAGGGSFLTLPMLILLGLPATMANGTNRLGILMQNVSAVWGFRRHGIVEKGWFVRAGLPAMAGAVVGTLAALWIDDQAFRRILAFLMVAITLWTLWDPLSRRAGRGASHAPRGHAGLIAAGFFVAGIYGGFVQAGVGFLLLAVTTLAGHDLVRGNALKVLCVLAFTPVSLSLFVWNDQVAFLPGIALGAGMLLGAWIGVRLTVLRGHRWIRGVVTVVVIVLAVKLWLES